MNEIFTKLCLSRELNHISFALSEATKAINSGEWNTAIGALAGEEHTVRELITILSFLRNVEHATVTSSPKLDDSKRCAVAGCNNAVTGTIAYCRAHEDY